MYWETEKSKIAVEKILSKLSLDQALKDAAYACYHQGYANAWDEIRALGKAIEQGPLEKEPASGAV